MNKSDLVILLFKNFKLPINYELKFLTPHQGSLQPGPSYLDASFPSLTPPPPIPGTSRQSGTGVLAIFWIALPSSLRTWR
jgi:hypothetical protein